LSLLVTFLNVPALPATEALLPLPTEDPFAEGEPHLPAWCEAGLICIVLLAAFYLRLANLEYVPGIFGDEGERGVSARMLLEGYPATLFDSGWYGVPTFYFYCVAWMLRIFGDSMVGARMLSALSGVVAVWLAYRIGRALWSARTGLLAAAMLAVSPLALQFSRQATESTPTGTLWAGGFLFFVRALRGRRWGDWVCAGVLYGLSLYFYAAGKLVLGLLPMLGLYCVVRWRLDFFRRYALGFTLMCAAFALTFLPYALMSAHDGWQNFAGRAQETSILSAHNQADTFARHAIAYDPGWAQQSLLRNVLTHPVSWAQMLFGQLRFTAEVLYWHGDPTAFFQIRQHGGSMLAPLPAALTILGLAYAAWNIWDPRFGLLCVWFWCGMLGPALTINTPSVQRLVCAWPAVMLFPAVVLDRVWAAAWPVSRSLARRWAAVPLLALLVYFGIDCYEEYFIHYTSLCPYCTETVQARYAQALGQAYKVYQLGVGDGDIWFGYGSSRFVAKGVEGMEVAALADT
ncbi:MAG: ArnT family glycosyltransferase, partial [Gaiellaceae bacterium]